MGSLATDDIVQVSDIDGRIAPYDWAFAREEATRIDQHWAERRAATPALFDGRVLLMHEVSIKAGRLRLSCFEASFKSFLCWRELGFRGAPIANCFGMAALQAADGAFMLGEMNAGTAAAGRLYFPAGTPEPADLDTENRLDLGASVLRELEEETGLAPSEVAVEDGWTIVLAGPLVACMRLIRSRLTAAELQARLVMSNATQADPELVALVPVARRADYDCNRMPAFMLRYLDWAFDQAR